MAVPRCIHICTISKSICNVSKINLFFLQDTSEAAASKREVNLYNSEELERLFKLVKGALLELDVMFAAFYGLRRIEVLGLKWDTIEFNKNVITVYFLPIYGTDATSGANTKEIVLRKTFYY